MLNLLEITGDDIARLDDGELRDLIGLLCEADYRSAGSILWGVYQAPSTTFLVSIVDL